MSQGNSNASAPGLDSRLVTRVVLKNFLSVAACDVELRPLTFLVGPNGAGKSNFLDALRFVSDSLRTSLEHALLDRSGINEVRRRSGGHPTHFAMRLEVEFKEARGVYAFEIGAKADGGYSVAREDCLVTPCASGATRSFYRVEEGQVVQSSAAVFPAVSKDRLNLVNAAGLEEFRPLYDALSSIGVYNLNPVAMSSLQPPDPREILARDGGNLASVLAKLAKRNPEQKRRIEEYLGKVAPGITAVDRKALGPRETLEFRQEVGGAKHPWRFLAPSMSDGTMRALGILVALFQQSNGGVPGRRLVGIEEPEVALHPAAVGVLKDALLEASEQTQVLVTSHSTDLLDDDDLSDAGIFAVVSVEGETKIAPLESAGKSALRDHLYTAGELLRMDALRPDLGLVPKSSKQLSIFESLA